MSFLMRYVCPILGIKKILERSQLTRPQENVMTEKSRNFQQNVTNGESERLPCKEIQELWWQATTWHLILDFFTQN